MIMGDKGRKKMTRGNVTHVCLSPFTFHATQQVWGRQLYRGIPSDSCTGADSIGKVLYGGGRGGCSTETQNTVRLLNLSAVGSFYCSDSASSTAGAHPSRVPPYEKHLLCPRTKIAIIIITTVG